MVFLLDGDETIPNSVIDDPNGKLAKRKLNLFLNLERGGKNMKIVIKKLRTWKGSTHILLTLTMRVLLSHLPKTKHFDELEVQLLESKKRFNQINSEEAGYQPIELTNLFKLKVDYVEIKFDDFPKFQTKILKNLYFKIVGSKNHQKVVCSVELCSDKKSKIITSSKRKFRIEKGKQEIRSIPVVGNVYQMRIEGVNKQRSISMKELMDDIEDGAQTDQEKATRSELKCFYLEALDKEKEVRKNRRHEK